MIESKTTDKFSYRFCKIGKNRQQIIQLAIACSRLTIETLEKGLKYVQS